MEIMDQVTQKKVTGLIMSIDFEKCFDMILHSTIIGSLRYFGAGENYIRWVMLLFTKFQLCTQNNGYNSAWMEPSSGLHQGCCISPHLYNLTGQVFAHLFHNDTKIVGVKIHDILNLISQFADDTNLFLENEEQSLQEVSETFDIAYRNLGLKVNYDKTTIYRIGSLEEQC